MNFKNIFFFIEKTTCQTKCDVEIKGVNDVRNTLWYVDITVDSYSYEYSPCADQKDNHNILDMVIYCPKWNTGKYMKYYKKINESLTLT